jgi:hypothetical protein
VVTVYYLAIANVPFLKEVFGNFVVFAIFTISVGVPISILAGYIHFKKSRAYSSEMDITTEANPWYYKLTPGKEAMLSVPTTVISLQGYLRQNEIFEQVFGRAFLMPKEVDQIKQAIMKYKLLIERGDIRD